MPNRNHKAIIGAVIMVRAGKGKAQSVEFQLQQIKMVEAQKEVLQDYDGRLWALCYPEKEDNTPNRTTIEMTFWDDCLLGVQFHVEKVEILTSYFHSGAIASVGGGNDSHIIGKGNDSKGLIVVTVANDVGIVGHVELTEQGVKK